MGLGQATLGRRKISARGRPLKIPFDIRPSKIEIGFMPLYEYELCEGECKICGGKFTLRRPLSAPELTKCPACKKPVRKIISSFSTPHKLKPLSISDAKKAGFTVLKKIKKGEYERQ
jgi:putative FmdB family regulatory protein